MPAATITKVNPKAITAMVETWMPMFMRFGPVRKRGVAMKRARQRTTSPTSAPLLARKALKSKLFCVVATLLISCFLLRFHGAHYSLPIA